MQLSPINVLWIMTQYKLVTMKQKNTPDIQYKSVVHSWCLNSHYNVKYINAWYTAHFVQFSVLIILAYFIKVFNCVKMH